jgi:hypothetical protein
MKLPRVRITMRLLMAVVAAVALSLFLAQEFGEGLAPRFVLRSIPGRISRLRPGMTRAQTYEVLGNGKSWLTGGTGARLGARRAVGSTIDERLHIGPPNVDRAGSDWVFWPSAMIKLRFRRDPNWSGSDDDDKHTHLESATYYFDFRTIAKMPGSSPIDP